MGFGIQVQQAHSRVGARSRRLAASRMLFVLTVALTLACILPLSATAAASMPLSAKWAQRGR